MHRLTRLHEVHTDQNFYFLTFCTHQRAAVLAHPFIHASLQLFGQEGISRKVFVGRYVIMPDHIHLFVALPDEISLSSWVKSLKNSLSKTLRELGNAAPHWQKGFFDHLMRSEDSYGSKWDYVQQNPVRKDLVSDAATWPYQGEINLLPFH